MSAAHMLSLGNLEEWTNIFIGNAFFKVYMEIFPNNLVDFSFSAAVLFIYMGQVSLRASGNQRWCPALCQASDAGDFWK